MPAGTVEPHLEQREGIVDRSRLVAQLGEAHDARCHDDDAPTTVFSGKFMA